jgi:hypothetical protein
MVVIVLCGLWATHDAHAEHTVDHRYTIWGYVKDADGAPIQDALVVISDRPDVRLGVARTNTHGQYRVQLHLHNSDLGRQLTIEAHQVSHRLRVTFDPDDTFSERRHRVDFLGAQVHETLPTAGSLTPYVLGVVGVAVVGVPALWYVRGRGKRAAGGGVRSKRRSPKGRAGRQARQPKQPGKNR